MQDDAKGYMGMAKKDEQKFMQLQQDVAAGRQDIDIENFRIEYGLELDWTWDDIAILIAEGKTTVEQVIRVIHEGLR